VNKDIVNALANEPQFAEIRQLAAKIVAKVLAANSEKLVFPKKTFSLDMAREYAEFREKLKENGFITSSMKDEVLYEEIIHKISAQQVRRAL
jgi:hypothetical protein